MIDGNSSRSQTRHRFDSLACDGPSFYRHPTSVILLIRVLFTTTVMRQLHKPASPTQFLVCVYLRQISIYLFYFLKHL